MRRAAPRGDGTLRGLRQDLVRRDHPLLEQYPEGSPTQGGTCSPAEVRRYSTTPAIPASNRASPQRAGAIEHRAARAAGSAAPRSSLSPMRQRNAISSFCPGDKSSWWMRSAQSAAEPSSWYVGHCRIVHVSASFEVYGVGWGLSRLPSVPIPNPTPSGTACCPHIGE